MNRSILYRLKIFVASLFPREFGGSSFKTVLVLTEVLMARSLTERYSILDIICTNYKVLIGYQYEFDYLFTKVYFCINKLIYV